MLSCVEAKKVHQLTLVECEYLNIFCRVRVSWGQLENFKCVDYFQIEYYEEGDPVGTAKLSGKINRHRRSHDIDIKPCSNWLFKVCTQHLGNIERYCILGYCL